MIKIIPVLVLTLTALQGCATMKIEDYEGTTPALILEDYFLGDVTAWGIFQDRTGMVKRQFVVDITGTRDDDGLRLEEDFRYRDGERSRRIWFIRKTGEHTYEGRAEDVVGTASGVAQGNALHWNYQLALAVKGKTWKVHFDDWMYLQEDGVLINRATMSKFGIRLGEVTIVFRKAA